jgi:hypothetical protein
MVMVHKLIFGAVIYSIMVRSKVAPCGLSYGNRNLTLIREKKPNRKNLRLDSKSLSGQQIQQDQIADNRNNR